MQGQPLKSLICISSSPSLDDLCELRNIFSRPVNSRDQHAKQVESQMVEKACVIRYTEDIPNPHHGSKYIEE